MDFTSLFLADAGLADQGLLAGLVLREQGLGTIDVALLTALGATAEQHDQGLTVLRQILITAYGHGSMATYKLLTVHTQGRAGAAVFG